MVAIFLWELESEKLNKLPTENQEKSFKKTFETEEELKQGFERLGQKKRIGLLLELELIKPGTKSSFDEIRKTRIKYLHYLTQDHDSLPEDAINLFHKAESLVAIAVGRKVSTMERSSYPTS